MVKRHAGVLQDLESETYGALREQAVATRDEMRAGAPAFSGELRQGIKFRTSRKRFTASVKATAHHSWLVQHGRTPGKMPSVDPAHAKNPKSAQRLQDFAKAHNIEPFLLARAIARKGTRAHPFRIIGVAAKSFQSRMQAAVDRVIRKYR